MSNLLSSFGIVSYITEEMLIVQLQSDFYTEVIDALRTDISYKLHESKKIKGLIIDVSKINLLDLMDMKILEQMLKIAIDLNIPAYLTGLHRSIHSVLQELEYDFKHISMALTIEQATKALKHDLTK